MILCTKSCPTRVTPGTVDRQIPLSMGFSRKECCSGLPLISPGACPDEGIESAPISHIGRWILYVLCHLGSPKKPQNACAYMCIHTHTHTHIYIHTYTQFVCVSYTNTVEHSCIYIYVYIHIQYLCVSLHKYLEYFCICKYI